MIFPVADLPPLPSVDAAEHTEHRPPARLRLLEEPAGEIRQTFSLRKSVLQIEPGQLQLRLTQHPQISVDSSNLECEVVGWGVQLHARDADKFASTMARRFLELFSKADQGKLSESEQATWLTVLDQVDFQTFCIDRAQPHYVEGVITDKQLSFIRVEWHDGSREKIVSPASRPLQHLLKGDSFGAWVKLGRDNKATRIENVTMIEPTEYDQCRFGS